MYTRNIKKILKQSFIPVIVFVGIFSFWEFIVLTTHYPEYLLPRPSLIFRELISNFDTLIYHAGITLFEAIAGFLIANVLAFLVAIIFAHSQKTELGLQPFVVALQTTPIIAMAPLLVIWFGTGIGSKIAAAAVVSFFPTIINGTKGLKAIEENMLDLFKSLSATPWQIFVKLRLPNSLPFLFSAFKTSAALSVIGAIVGEFVGANKGIGYIILISTYHMETVTMFTGIIMSAATGMLFFWVIRLIEKKVVFWQKS